jgi:PrgI family protein
MPSYQVPQFLDSGDKILGPLNLRQFAYALVGGLTLFGIFNFLTAVVKLNIIFAVFIVLPPAIVISIIAIGKYNGRDAEIYILKFVEYFTKPKKMLYKKVAQTPELNKRLTKLTPSYLNAVLEGRLRESKKELDTKKIFKAQTAAEKIESIRMLSQGVDQQRSASIASIESIREQNSQRAKEVFDKEMDVYKRKDRQGTTLAPRA